MDRKIVMGVAAVAGIGLLLYLRKSGDSSAIGSAGTLLGAAAAANNWATQPIVINTKAPAVVADQAAKTPAPAPAPSVAAPWTSAPIQGEVSWGGSGWLQANGKPVADGYGFAHLTPEQRAGRTDAELVRGYA